ncbi:MAG: glycosyltransferase [Sedimentisphaerales bacterium]|nr:glycosyltransferase [Sedimentisphaerales bacterium]
MNVFILTIGSRGDVQPFVALGKGLKAAGHKVTLCTSSSFEPFIRSHGLDYGYMTDELLKLMDSDAGRDAMENTNGISGTIKTTIKLMKKAKPINRQMLKDSWRAAQAAEPDIVLFHPKALGGVHIAEKLGVPVMMALPLPMIVPTAESPTIGFPNWNIGGWYNKLTYAFVRMGFHMYNGTINKFRQDILNLHKFPKSSSLLRMADGRPIPVLHPFSTHVVPRPHDWPGNAYITGYWFLNRLNEWKPSAELKAFFAEGETPVYVGFGSMAGRNPRRIANIVIEALQQANVRGIIATGWGGLVLDDLPDGIFKIDKVPHDWLFPRVTAVVHHGGAGTTAAGLRAGRPTIICPFFGDQPYWGQLVYSLGVGSKPIPQKKMTVEKLAAAIREVTTDQKIRQNAESLGEKIRNEDGVANAVAIIERTGIKV